MSRILKLAALTAGTIVLLLMATAAIVVARINPNDYKDDVIRLVHQRHQRTLAIPGSVRLALFPRLGAHLGQVSLSEHGGSGQFAAIDSARVSVALAPLLRGELVIDRIDITGMQATVIRYPDGSMNTGDLTSERAPQNSSASGASVPGTPVRLAIDSIRVGDARILFDDRKGARRMEISHLHIDSGPIARGVASRMALSANIRMDRPALSTAITLKSSFLPDRARRRIAFSAVEANLDLSFKQAKVKVTGQIDVDLDKDEFAADLKGTFDASAFDLQSGLRDKAYHLTMHVDQLDLGRYQNRLVPDAVPGDPAILEAGDAFDLSPLSMLRASGGVHVGELKVGAIRASNVRAALRSDAGKFVLQPIGASLYDGTGSGAITLDFTRSASTPRITLVQNLKAVQVGALLHDLTGKRPIDGRGDIMVDVSTEGASTLQMRQNLAGTASLRVADGALRGIDLSVLASRGRNGSGSAADGATTSFDQLAADFTIAGGIAHNTTLALRAPLFGMTGYGDIDLAREQLDYTLVGTLNGTAISVPLKLGGPWDAIEWHVDLQAMPGEAAVEKARDKLSKAIRGLLKR